MVQGWGADHHGRAVPLVTRAIAYVGEQRMDDLEDPASHAPRGHDPKTRMVPAPCVQHLPDGFGLERPGFGGPDEVGECAEQPVRWGAEGQGNGPWPGVGAKVSADRADRSPSATLEGRQTLGIAQAGAIFALKNQDLGQAKLSGDPTVMSTTQRARAGMLAAAEGLGKPDSEHRIGVSILPGVRDRPPP